MREIKFRCYYHGEMNYDPELLYNENVNLNEQIDELAYYGVLMQYTGLKDKNGTDIYEGDVIRFKVGDIVSYYVVKFENGGFNHNENLEYIDVVGNIYENPELNNIIQK